MLNYLEYFVSFTPNFFSPLFLKWENSSKFARFRYLIENLKLPE